MVRREYKKCNLCKRKKRTSVKTKTFICRPCRAFVRRLANQISGSENYPHMLKPVHVSISLALEKDASPAKELSKKLKLPLPSIYRHLSYLSNGYLVEKIGMLYALTNRGKRIIRNLKGWDLEWVFSRNRKATRCLRFHCLQGKFNVWNPPHNYEKWVNRYMSFTVGRSKTQKGFTLEVLQCIVVFYNPKSISVTCPDIFVNSLDEARVAEGYGKLGQLIDSLAEKLEERFPGLKIDSFRPFDLDNQHIAIRNSKYAQRYFEKHGCNLKGHKIITDNSKKRRELEAFHPQSAGEDIGECLKMEKAVDEDEHKNISEKTNRQN